MADPSPYRNVEQVALDVCADLFAADHLGTSTPDNLEQRLPFLRVRRIGGYDADPFTDRARISVDVFAGSYADGVAKAEAVRQRYRSGPYPFDRVDTVTGPVETPWSDGSDVRRWTATYLMSSRRSAAS